MHTGYRSGEQYYERGLTALDVVRHEHEDLGNDILLLTTTDELASIPMSNVAWVCRSKEEAQRYGYEVQPITFKRLLAMDKEDPQGYLVELA